MPTMEIGVTTLPKNWCIASFSLGFLFSLSSTINPPARPPTTADVASPMTLNIFLKSTLNMSDTLKLPFFAIFAAANKYPRVVIALPASAALFTCPSLSFFTKPLRGFSLYFITPAFFTLCDGE